MRDTGKITITMAEYKRLVQADIQLDIITNIAKSSKGISGTALKVLLGIPEDENE